MSELRVPTLALSAQVLCADGRSWNGRIFIPVTASRHSGPMRAEEWINEPRAFFPFLPDDADAPVFLNKEEVVALSVAASADPHLPDDPQAPERHLTVECGGQRLEGTVTLDLPSGQARVLDVLNRPDSFLILRDEDRHHYVLKHRITRVQETREG
jgi:hypothetical protein